MMLRLTVPLILSAAAIVGCTSSASDTRVSPTPGKPAGSVTLLAPADFQSSITRSDVFVVNVHIPYEGEIEGTDAFIPFDEIQEHAAELPMDKSAPLYIYCRSGRMSAEATPDLQRLGYSNIIDLAGGMRAWEEAGLPLTHRAAARATGG
jgi:rhodanese-related sulfurtransferase